MPRIDLGHQHDQDDQRCQTAPLTGQGVSGRAPTNQLRITPITFGPKSWTDHENSCRSVASDSLTSGELP